MFRKDTDRFCRLCWMGDDEELEEKENEIYERNRYTYKRAGERVHH